MLNVPARRMDAFLERFGDAMQAFAAVALIVAGGVLSLTTLSRDANAALALGAAVGAGELLARYKDAPLRAVFTIPGAFYIAVNAAASAAALAVAVGLDWTFGIDAAADPERLRWTRIAVAGFGAIAFFRSSVFTARVGTQDVQVGPSTVLTTILGVADAQVDRGRAREIARKAAEIMRAVDYERARSALATAGLAALQNMNASDQEALANALNALDANDALDDWAKRQVLGTVLIRSLGEALLHDLVSSLGEHLRPGPSGNPPTAGGAP